MVWSRKRFFLLVGIIAFISSLAVSFLIHPKFQSTAVLLPAISTQPSKDIVVPNRVKGFIMFGEDEEAVSYTHLDVYKRQVKLPYG